MSTATVTQAPARYATGDQIDDAASGLVAFASFLLDERELAPIRTAGRLESCHLPDLPTLERFAAHLGMPVTQKAGQWRAVKEFGPAFTYVLWTEVLPS